MPDSRPPVQCAYFYRHESFPGSKTTERGSSRSCWERGCESTLIRKNCRRERRHSNPCIFLTPRRLRRNCPELAPYAAPVHGLSGGGFSEGVIFTSASFQRQAWNGVGFN